VPARYRRAATEAAAVLQAQAEAQDAAEAEGALAPEALQVEEARAATLAGVAMVEAEEWTRARRSGPPA